MISAEIMLQICIYDWSQYKNDARQLTNYVRPHTVIIITSSYKLTLPIECITLPHTL